MDCKTFRRYLATLLGDQIDGRTRASMVSHESDCADCRELHEARLSLRLIVTETNRDERLSPFIVDLLEWAKERKRGTGPAR